MIRWIMFLIGVFGMVLGIGGAVNDDIWVLMIGFFPFRNVDDVCNPKRMNTPKQIVKIEEAISKASGISIEQMRDRNRHREFSEARQAVWLIAYDYFCYSYPFIAAIYERDHTTIMSGVDRMRNSGLNRTILTALLKHSPELIEALVEKGKPGFPNSGVRTISAWK